MKRFALKKITLLGVQRMDSFCETGEEDLAVF